MSKDKQRRTLIQQLKYHFGLNKVSGKKHAAEIRKIANRAKKKNN